MTDTMHPTEQWARWAVREAVKRSPSFGLGHPFVEAVKIMFERERTARAALEREVAALKQELTTLRAEAGVERRIADLGERLSRIETARATCGRCLSCRATTCQTELPTVR
jgi:hypothetical protein